MRFRRHRHHFDYTGMTEDDERWMFHYKCKCGQVKTDSEWKSMDQKILEAIKKMHK